MEIAKHEPQKLYKRNRGLASMSQDQLSEFTDTPRKGLPEHVPGPKKYRPKG